MLATILAVASGAIAWVIAYFATQTAVSQLECRLTHQIIALQHDIRAARYQAEVDTRQSLVKLPSNKSSVQKLMEEVFDSTTKSNAERDASINELRRSARCLNAN
jgi:uncharacterized lipoprotein YajG